MQKMKFSRILEEKRERSIFRAKDYVHSHVKELKTNRRESINLVILATKFAFKEKALINIYKIVSKVLT